MHLHRVQIPHYVDMLVVTPSRCTGDQCISVHKQTRTIPYPAECSAIAMNSQPYSRCTALRGCSAMQLLASLGRTAGTTRTPSVRMIDPHRSFQGGIDHSRGHGRKATNRLRQKPGDILSRDERVGEGGGLKAVIRCSPRCLVLFLCPVRPRMADLC